MKSLLMRQFALTAGQILLCLVMLGTAFITLTYSRLSAEAERAITANSISVKQIASAYATTGDLEGNWDLSMSLTFAAQVSGADIVICDTSGEVILSSSNTLKDSRLGIVIDQAVTNEILATGQYNDTSTLNGFYSEKSLIMGTSLVSEVTGEVTGIVLVSVGLSENQALISTIATVFFLSAIVVLIISFGVTLIVVRKQTRPLKDMASAARHFAGGDFTARVNAGNRRDEVGELAVAFNAMAQSLDKAENLRRDFVANVSHELKTPMTTIGGFVDGILDGTIPYEKQQEYLSIVRDEVRRLSRLVAKMLELSRLQSAENRLKTERFNLTELLTRTLLRFEQKINAKKLDVELDCPEHDIFAFAEADSITQVISNLMDNAIKFSTENTSLKLGISTRGGKVFVYVENSGPTISPQEQAMIFDRFHKTDRSRGMDREGVGLGLYIVKEILKKHGETVSVSSENGVTRFTFTLKQAS